jgi:hypothetical protein
MLLKKTSRGLSLREDTFLLAHLLYYVTPRAVGFADVGATLLQALVQSVTVQLADVAVLLVLLKSDQGCQIFLGATHQNMNNVSNDHKIYQMTIK